MPAKRCPNASISGRDTERHWPPGDGFQCGRQTFRTVFVWFRPGLRSRVWPNGSKAAEGDGDRTQNSRLKVDHCFATTFSRFSYFPAVHGGSTWNSGVNQAQVRDGAEILGFLMPVFIDIMKDNPNENWGKPFYPVVE